MSTLFELLARLEQADELDLSLEDHNEILTNTQQKIDAYAEVINRYESEAERYKKLADDFDRRSKIFTNEVKRIEMHLVSACKFHGVKQFKGLKHELKFVARTLLKAKEAAGPEMFKKYPTYCMQTVAIEHKWDMDKLKADFKTGNEVAKELIEETKSEFVKFST